MNPKEVFHGALQQDEIDKLREAGISGVVRIGNFEAVFLSLEGVRVPVQLTSAAVWLGVCTDEKDYVLFTEQADQRLEDGSHPWEVPSGLINPDKDTNIYGTAQREVLEETG